MIQNLRLVLILCVFLLGGNGFAQQITHWKKEDGLSSNRVIDGVQAEDGFIWFATNAGLSRYDGYRFETFSTLNYPQLVSDEISCMLQTADNELWIGTENHGISVFDLKTYQVKVNYTSENGGLRSNKIAAIEQSGEGTIWIASKDGDVGFYDGNKFVWLLNSSSSDQLFGFCESITIAEDKLYINSSDRGIFRVDIASGNLGLHIEMPSDFHPGKSLYVESEGTVFCLQNGLKILRNSADSLVAYKPEITEETFEIFVDSKQTSWIVLDERRKLLGVDANNRVHFSSQVLDPSANVLISEIFEDRSKNIWLCTSNGVYKIVNRDYVFSSILRSGYENNEDFIPSFRGMLEDEQGDIFIGGYNGLFKYSDENKITCLFDNTIPYSPYILIDKNPTELWVLSEGYGVMSVNKTSSEIVLFRNNLLRNGGYKGIYLQGGILAKDSDFWLSSYEGIIRFDTQEERYYTQELVYENHQIHTYPARQILESTNGEIWICTQNGAFVLNSNGSPVKHYHTEGEGEFKIPFNDINCIEESDNGKIWIGSKSAGVTIIEKETVQSITVENGLCDNGIAFIVEDNQNQLWIGTNNGLSQYETETEKITSFYTGDGLSSNEFNHASKLKTRSGRLFFGGVNGINIYSSDSDKETEKVIRKIRLSRIEIPAYTDSTAVFLNENRVPEVINLNYDRASLYVEFFIDDFVQSEKNNFEYFMVGYSDKWEQLGNKNNIRFAGMAPGNYELKIRGTDSGGIRTQNEIVIPIVVAEIFYKTWWFILLFSIGILTIAGYIIYLRFKKLKVVTEMRREIASDMHDDIGSTLTRIAMKSELLEAKSEGKQKEVLKGIAQNCRSAVTNMRDMVWGIDSRSLAMGNLFDKIQEHLIQMMDEQQLEYQFDFDSGIESLQLNPIQKKETFFIFKEAVNNHIKHSGKAALHVEISKNGSKILMRIGTEKQKDQSSSPSTGLGIKNMQMRAAKINAGFKIHDKNGFTVELIIPVQQKFSNFIWRWRK